MRRRHDIKPILAAVLLAGCSEQTAECEPFVEEIIWFNELEERYPIEVGTSSETRDRIESIQFKTECLFLHRPQFKAGMNYSETRESREGERIFLFTPFAVSDTLIGFVQSKNGAHVVIVGML